MECALETREYVSILHVLPARERRDPVLDGRLRRLPAAPERFAPADEPIARGDAYEQAIHRVARDAAEGRLRRPVIVGNAQRDGFDAVDGDGHFQSRWRSSWSENRLPLFGMMR